MNNDVIASMSEMDVSNVTPTQDFLNVESTAQTDPTDPADDAIWILTSTFIIFTMQSGKKSMHYIIHLKDTLFL